MHMQFKCDCQTIRAIDGNWNNILNQFESLRRNCPALREILVPDSVWPEFSKMAPSAYDESGHRSILLGALRSGNLKKITLPIHSYLLDGEKPRDKLTNQYKKDLIEKWMSEDTPLERHRKARGYNGKLAELMSCSWIESQGWKIINLAALGGNFDIEAISPQKKKGVIEVKYIGLEDRRFEDILESLKLRKAKCTGLGFYDGYNYILLRAYEATRQLLNLKEDLYVFIVISNLAWDFLDMPVEDNWFLQRPTSFIDSASLRWKEFLSKKKKEKKYQNIDKEIKTILNRIKELWIIKNENWEYHLSKIIKFKED